MNKRNKKVKKAAQLAAKVNAAAAAAAAAAASQKKIDEEKGAKAVVEGGACAKKPELDPAYHKKLKKIIDLAGKLPNGLVLHPNTPKEQKSDEERDSNGSRKASDDEAPDLVKPHSSQFCHRSDHAQGGPTCSDDNQKFSRGEKKARRLLMKLDLKPVEDVYRVTMKKSKNIILIIEHPDVFMCPTGTIIIFGKVLVEDLTNKAASQAAERYKELEAVKGKEEKKAVATAGTAAVADDDGADVDEGAAKKLDRNDIELVQMQAACSRKQAVKALLKNGHDVVNAIMDLTMG